jgi:hypothetical protein
MTRAWCIVSVYRPDLLAPAKRALEMHPDIEVIVDRRIGERRRPERAESDETRARERRHLEIDSALRAHGYAIVSRADAP